MQDIFQNPPFLLAISFVLFLGFLWGRLKPLRFRFDPSADRIKSNVRPIYVKIIGKDGRDGPRQYVLHFKRKRIGFDIAHASWSQPTLPNGRYQWLLDDIGHEIFGADKLNKFVVHARTYRFKSIKEQEVILKVIKKAMRVDLSRTEGHSICGEIVYTDSFRERLDAGDFLAP